MFSPASGINEDPVTGNANGPLGAYLVKYNLVPTSGDLFEFSIVQGEKIKRPGTMLVRVFLNHGQPVKIQLGGEAVIAFKTEIIL
jgi:Predicted epimerase, PhzC/PhzF homolog